MPRQARLDVEGTLHHVIIRGIEKRRRVDDEKDRENFIKRLKIWGHILNIKYRPRKLCGQACLLTFGSSRNSGILSFCFLRSAIFPAE